MKIKTSELTNLALDWAVAKCKGIPVTYHNDGITREIMRLHSDGQRYNGRCNPSTCWAQGGPILEREQIKVVKGNPLYFPQRNEKGDHYEPLWIASVDSGRSSHGRSYLEAAMRCYVASKLGDTVDIPEELLCPSPTTNAVS